jgi:3-methyladenine DNA glycosylase AlkD
MVAKAFGWVLQQLGLRNTKDMKDRDLAKKDQVADDKLDEAIAKKDPNIGKML